MRLKCKVTGNTEPVPYNHIHQLTGALQKWLGPDNPYHDGTSLYGFAWLRGARTKDGALHFPDGATWSLSFHDEEMARRVVEGMMMDASIAFGMRVYDVEQKVTPEYGGCVRFEVDSPVVTRRTREDGSKEYLLFDDDTAAETLTRTLRYKLELAGFSGKHLESRVQFDRMYDGARTKLTTIKGIHHKGSICPVVVAGTPEAVQFAWNVGVGELTGSGFGALK
jgi:CRISPR-associated endoribonuclease Cas6